MKRLIIATVLFLSGCATPETPAQVQLQFVQACEAYNAAFITALQLRTEGKLSAAQVAAVSQIDAQVTPLCSGPLPADATAATQTITAATTALAVQYAVQQSEKK